MRRKLLALSLAAFTALSVVGPAAASQPPGLRGYEGHLATRGGTMAVAVRVKGIRDVVARAAPSRG